ncbi:cytochrome d ubiquinol oxidase subunit II [Neisseriaceae bacterium ESL0693]|nr:cytochrome d ubiquinol oxidase subunit II [Neisseriaceae bacterium ESL0693]
MQWIDYSVLRLIWWALLGILLIGFAIMDGQDMGMGTLLPFVAKTDTERRTLINTVAPHWDGNQVWFITGGASIFAAWPMVYATAFSGFYWAMMAVLWALFFRPVGFDYRSKIHNPRWRQSWDWGIFIGSFIPPVIFGVAFGNLFLGLPFQFNDELRSFYYGSFWQLLNPFALICGLVSISMMVFHGAIYLNVRTDGQIQQRVRKAAALALVVCLSAFTFAGVFITQDIFGYGLIEGSYQPNAMSDPLLKEVYTAPGLWMRNYYLYPILILVPFLAYVSLLGAWLLAKANKNHCAFWCSAAGMACIVLTAGIALFPFLLPSSIDPRSSLIIWDASSSKRTLLVMLIVSVIFIPLIVTYTSWCYHVLRGKITPKFIKDNDHNIY